MDLERIAVALRPRGNFEAIDLGFRMAAQWWRPLWGVWLVLFAPFVLVLQLALLEQPFVAVVVAWWMKPLFERFLLYVVSRRVFGEDTGVLDALRAWREVLSPGLIGALSWQRLVSPTRSFSLPVAQLERSAGAAARARQRVLGNRTSGHAFALSLVCLCFELVLLLGLGLLVDVMFNPGEVEGAALSDPVVWWTAVDTLFYAIAASVIAPFYVSAGFALYLNRRVGLEAWDVELSLRRLQQRLLRGTSATAVLLLCVLAALPFAAAWARAPADAAAAPAEVALQTSADAQPAWSPQDTEAKQAARALYQDPVFGSTREVRHWQWRWSNDDVDDATRKQDLGWLGTLGDWIAAAIQLLGWIAIGAVLVAILVVAMRVSGKASVRLAARAPPTQLFGLEIAPESLPGDIQAAALAACAAGDARTALSLVYRGALSTLVHRHALTIAAGAVEADVLRAARVALSTPAAAWLERLLAQWIAVAWARTAPDINAIAALAREYNRHFGAGLAPDTGIATASPA